ncbi:MAG: ATP-binding cassette domain-containing protein [Ruminococcaceae bacterium]|nr:ATP-binding cassette domain-containing protein [Oscillospiraceae bacterium]
MADRNTLRTKAIWQITERLRDADDLVEAMAHSLEIIKDVLDCEAGSVWLLSKSTNRVCAVVNVGTDDITGFSVESGQGIVGSVAKSGESIIVEDTSTDTRFSKSVDEETGFVTKSIICVPLKNEYETIGCVEIINKRSGASYTAEDLALCEQMAALAAIAIEEKGFSFEPEQEKRVIISLRNVVKEFPSGDSVLRVLKGINLDVYENEFVVVLGESGCGKSTMMNIIGGMDFLTSGTLTVEGKDFSHPSDAELTDFRRNYVGFVFQAYNLMPNLTARENVQFIAEISPDPGDVDAAIAKVGLTERANNYPAQMSGGQQQRVSIARALAKNPKVIFADEPTAALDFQTSVEVLRVFENIVNSNGTTVMMITHNEEIAKMANRVVKLKGGTVASIRSNLHPLHADDLSW